MRRSIPLLLILLLAGTVVPARAGTISLSGNFSGGVTFLKSLAPDVVPQAFVGGGNDTTYGAFTATSQSTVDSTDPSQPLFSDGTLGLIFGKKGTLGGTYSGSGTVNSDGTTSFTIDLLITSGSGIFAGATGTVIITGDISTVSPRPMVIQGTYVATLAIPEPNSLTLLALAVTCGAGVMLNRGRKGRPQRSAPLP